MIGQILEYNTVVTKAEFLFMIQSASSQTYHPVHIPSHLVHTAAHCNPQQLSAANHLVHIQCTHTAAAITSLEHTAANLQYTLQPCTAMYSYLQTTFSAHCSQLQPSTAIYTAAILSSAHYSYTIQCTLQLYHPVHTAAIPSGAHCSYTIWY